MYVYMYMYVCIYIYIGGPRPTGSRGGRRTSRIARRVSCYFWDVNQHPKLDVNNLFIDKTVKFETCICYVSYLMGAQKFQSCVHYASYP